MTRALTLLLVLCSPATILAQQTPAAKPPAARTTAAKPDPRLAAIRAAIDRGEPESAIAQAEALLDKSPRQVEALTLLGMARERSGNTAAAEQLYRRALAASTVALEPALRLAELRAGESPQQAIEILAPRVQPTTRRLDARLLLGSLYDRAGKPQLAQRHYAAAATHHPKSATALLHLARHRKEARDFPGALELLRRATAVAPNSAALLYEHGFVALQAASYKEALRAAGSAAHLEPDNPQHLYLMGLAHLWNQQSVLAVDPLRRAAELDPAKPSYQLGLAAALIQRRELAEARGPLDRCLALSPEHHECLYLLADIEQTEGNADRAEELSRRVLRAAPRHPGANLVLGTLLSKRGEFPAARRHLELATAGDPGFGKAWYQLSIVYNRLNMPQPAQDALARYQRIRGQLGGDDADSPSKELLPVNPPNPR